MKNNVKREFLLWCLFVCIVAALYNGLGYLVILLVIIQFILLIKYKEVV